MNAAKTVLALFKRHRTFALFMLACLILNIMLLLRQHRARDNFITCSAFDRGPLGTYGLFEDLKASGAPVYRMRLPPYRELNPKTDSGGTLVIISPIVKPSAWEWDWIMRWTAAGNRLITAGVYGPRSLLPQLSRTVRLQTSWEKPAPVRLSLPVDSVLRTGAMLPRQLPVEHLIFTSDPVTFPDSFALTSIKSFSPDMLPLLTWGKRTIAAKKAVGKGEWVIFTVANPFSNTWCADSAWYEFGARLLSTPATSGHPVYFDEYHNGYRATQSLWQLLSYYEFDGGIIYLSIAALLYLFFSGVRAATPLPRESVPEIDIIPGIRALSGLLFRRRAWSGLIRNECALVKKELARYHDAPGSPSSESLAAAYCRRFALPPPVPDQAALMRFFESADSRETVFDATEALDALNILTFIRKEMNL
jgi:hypothetical protein